MERIKIIRKGGLLLIGMNFNQKIGAIEEKVKKEVDSPSIVHDFDHLKRTAKGAKWYVKARQGSKEEENLAYVAGLLHDIKRPKSNKVDHVQASAEKGRRILNQFELKESQIERIIGAIKTHSMLENWEKNINSAVYFSDKVFEAMGAYIIFRRSTWVGESPDFSGKDPLQENIDHFKHRIEKHGKERFPDKLSRIVDYQFKFQENFLQDLKREKDYAVNLIQYCYKHGEKNDKESFERLIRDFNPEERRNEKLKEETINYLEGELLKKFEGKVD